MPTGRWGLNTRVTSLAEASLGNVKLSRYSRAAGNRALGNYAYEEAIVHYERALAAKEGEAIDAEIAGVLLGLGRACLSTVAVWVLCGAGLADSRLTHQGHRATSAR